MKFSATLVCLLFLVAGLDECLGSTKQWTQDVNFGNPANWDVDRVPCTRDTVVFPETTNVVYLQSNGTLHEVILPNNGQVVLASTMTIAFSDESDPQCNEQGTALFTADNPKQWFDPDNWEDQEGPVTVETEMVPCQYDDVSFPKKKLYSVALNQSISVGTINIAGQEYTGMQMVSYLQSSNGKLQFAVEDDVTINVYGYGCPDSTGCICGNDKPQIKNMICSMVSCDALTCQNPVTPEGACCDKCGAVLTIEFDHAVFHMDQFKTRIKTTYGGTVNVEKRETKRQVSTSAESEIIFYISKTGAEKIQLVITDRETGSSSGRLAVEMAQRILRDMRNDMASFGITSVTSQTSSRGTGSRSGGSDSLSGGGIAGVILTAFIVLAIAVTAVFMYCRRVSFRKDEPLHADIEMTPSVRTEYVHELPVDPSVVKGFDNPIYATTPSPTKEGKPLYSDPTKASQQTNGQQVNGHQRKGSVEKNSYDHEAAANGLENMEQRDSTIVGLAFSNPMPTINIEESKT